MSNFEYFFVEDLVSKYQLKEAIGFGKAQVNKETKRLEGRQKISLSPYTCLLSLH